MTNLANAFKDWYGPAEGLILAREGDEGGAQGVGAGPRAPVQDEFRLSLATVQDEDVRVVAQTARPTVLALSLDDASGRALAGTRRVGLGTGSHVLSLTKLCGIGTLPCGLYFVWYEADAALGAARFTARR